MHQLPAFGPDAAYYKELIDEISRLNGVIMEKDSLIESLQQTIEAKDRIIAAMQEKARGDDTAIASLKEKAKELGRKAHMNSSNSSVPPSKDGYNKPSPKSLREKSGRKPGGQKGHKGSNIKLGKEPDEVVDHFPAKCLGCPNFSECSKGPNFVSIENRYVIDIEVKKKVTEHRKMSGKCPFDKNDKGYDRPCVGSFPENVRAYIQYGDALQVLVALLDSYGYMGDYRISQVIRDIFDVTLSPGTVVSICRRCGEKVAPAVEEICKKLKEEPVVHYDETGVSVNGKLFWVHNASTSKLTYQTISEKRGNAGIDENGVIAESKGVAEHDCWKAYYKYLNVLHALCCAHLLRELNGIEEMEPGHRWPKLFKQHLLYMKSLAE